MPIDDLPASRQPPSLAAAIRLAAAALVIDSIGQCVPEVWVITCFSVIAALSGLLPHSGR